MVTAILAAPEDQLSLSNQPISICPDQETGCVTVNSSTPSASIGELYRWKPITETQSNQPVTHPTLLSVVSIGGLEETRSSRRIAIDRSISDPISKQSSKFSIGSIVKRQQEQELLKITTINPDGTYWAKWFNPLVPRVAVILREDEICLVQDKSMA